MSTTYRQTLTDNLAARIDQARGSQSRQDFTTGALLTALEGCPCCKKLEAEIERLHRTLQAFAGQPAPAQDERLSF